MSKLYIFIQASLYIFRLAFIETQDFIALEQIPVDKFSGIVEMDETYFLYSEKGKRTITDRKPRNRGGSSGFREISKDQVCVLVARDRQT